jgi:hypothetical protein
MVAENTQTSPKYSDSVTLKKEIQTKRRAEIQATVIWLSDKDKIDSAPLLSNPRNSWYLAEFEFYFFSGGSSKLIFFLSGFGGSRCWVLWTAQWTDQTGRYSAKTPVAGILKKDTEDSVSAAKVLFFEYLKALPYEFLPNAIAGSEIISEDELDQLVSTASRLRG